jgi:hypothetical protein
MDAMQPPRRVSVDVSAAARFALLYFFSSSGSISAHVPTAAAGLRPRRIRLSAADPPGYQTPAQKKVRLSPPSQLAAVRLSRHGHSPGFFFPPGTTSAGARSVYCGRAKAGAGAVLVHYHCQARRV